ncbi:unnamed protein product [Schistosoma curassoni]|uniref:Uncharacterized protein n=1 Tax=Schistosoma curassoni TaxID=6186 RepID=A0A183K8K6_9TREM|nr:unnamed protein product [Schistosoma curassoni]
MDSSESIRRFGLCRRPSPPIPYTRIQMKTTSVAAASASVGLNIDKGKSKTFKYNTENTNPTTRDRETERCGSTIDEQGGSDADVKVRVGKAMAAFLQLKNI